MVNACPDLAECTVVLNGVSKAYVMTGRRIGHAAGPAPLIAATEVALVLGSAFGREGYLWLSFATGMDVLDERPHRLERLFGRR